MRAGTCRIVKFDREVRTPFATGSLQSASPVAYSLTPVLDLKVRHPCHVGEVGGDERFLRGLNRGLRPASSRHRETVNHRRPCVRKTTSSRPARMIS